MRRIYKGRKWVSSRAGAGAWLGNGTKVRGSKAVFKDTIRRDRRNGNLAVKRQARKDTEYKSLGENIMSREEWGTESRIGWDGAQNLQKRGRVQLTYLSY